MKKPAYNPLPEPEDVVDAPLLTHEERKNGLIVMLNTFGIGLLPHAVDTQDNKELARNLEAIWSHGPHGFAAWGAVALYVRYRESLNGVEGEKA